MSVVDQVKERLDVVEVIQAYVPLKKAGRNYKGLCPFHAEKTPSFVVFPDSGTWHCFGACATGGDVFSFIMKRENLDFGEALKLLAARAGVELEPRGAAAAEADQRLALLREINQAAAVYFHHLLLNSSEGAVARAYLEKRGLNQGTLDRFQVGYALDQWEGLLRYLTSKGYALPDLAEAGVITERDPVEGKSGYYDRFRGRIVFPIRDHQGQTIGFGARVLDDGVPKYLNSPQTPIFDKSSVLFGLDQARQGIRHSGLAVIVEGYTDVLMAHQHGITNVVAQMGTALTDAQLRLLKRYTSRFVLALDPDTAGDQATLRGLDTARQVLDREVVPVPTARGLIRYEDRLAADIRIASLPPGLDPDEVIRDSPAQWAEIVAQARPILDYYFESLTAGLDLATARGKAEAVRLLGPLVAELGDRVQRAHYLQRLARMVQVDERALWQQVRAGSGARQRARAAVQAAEKQEAEPMGLDAHGLSFLLMYPDLWPAIDAALRAGGEEMLQPEDLLRAEDRAILTAWTAWLEEGGAPDAQRAFAETLDAPLRERLDTLLQGQEDKPPVPDDVLRDHVVNIVTRVRLGNLRRKNQELRFLQEDAQSSGDRELHKVYGRIILEITNRIRRLEKAMDERSLMGRRRQQDAAVRMSLTEE